MISSLQISEVQEGDAGIYAAIASYHSHNSTVQFDINFAGELMLSTSDLIIIVDCIKSACQNLEDVPNAINAETWMSISWPGERINSHGNGPLFY